MHTQAQINEHYSNAKKARKANYITSSSIMNDLDHSSLEYITFIEAGNIHMYYREGYSNWQVKEGFSGTQSCSN